VVEKVQGKARCDQVSTLQAPTIGAASIRIGAIFLDARSCAAAPVDVYRDLWTWIDDPFQPPPISASLPKQLALQLA
jgi:hypothetical protein